MTQRDTPLICDWCNKEIWDYKDVGYDGPVASGRMTPGDRTCQVWQDWMVLCRDCEQQYRPDE